jgi:DNA-binding IclR family transcriptional regulator
MTRPIASARRCFRLAASALDELEMATLAKPILEALSRIPARPATSLFRTGDDIVVLARTAGVGPFQLADRCRRRHAGALHGHRQDSAGRR